MQMKLYREWTWKTARLAFVAAVIIAVPLTGCGQKEKPVADQEMDLSQPGDLFSQPVRSGEPEPDNSAAIATVDGEDITWGDVRREVDRAMKIAEQRQVPPEQMAQMRGQLTRQAAETLIIKRLLLREADRTNVVLTDEEIETARTQFMSRLPPGMTLDEALAKQNITKDEFDNEFATEVRINKLVESQAGDITEPTDEEVAKFYEENRDRMNVPETVTARHILIAVPPEATDEAKQAAKTKAEEVHAKLVEGADFAALAAEYSDCPSKARGGLLPRFGRGDMVKPFEDAAFSQKKDDIGPVVETPFGFHVIQVSEHSEAHEMTLDEVRADLVRGMKAQKRQLAIRDYVEGLKAKADIKFPGASSLPAPRPMPTPRPAKPIEAQTPPAAPEAAPAE
ncbi:MAG: peptidylprolyl isomerase [Verrucomicrobia bacterium]|nr:peptidylprolyl isomerase [Verrucomicrobiota bacterium]